MKQIPIFYALACVALVWVVYALGTIACLTCENIVFYLIPHLVLLILFIGFLCLYHKNLKSAYEKEKASKDDDLKRKMDWEKAQLDIYKLRKDFERDNNKEKVDFERSINKEKLLFDQLFAFVKEFKGKEEGTIKDEIEKLQKDIEMLKSKKDIFIDIAHKTFENNKTLNNEADGNTENKA